MVQGEASLSSILPWFLFALLALGALVGITLLTVAGPLVVCVIGILESLLGLAALGFLGGSFSFREGNFHPDALVQ